MPHIPESTPNSTGPQLAHLKSFPTFIVEHMEFDAGGFKEFSLQFWRGRAAAAEELDSSAGVATFSKM